MKRAALVLLALILFSAAIPARADTCPISGTFAQSWLVDSWDATDWIAEYRLMGEHCIGEIFLDTMRVETKRAYYPTDIPGYTNTVDHIGRALAYADVLGVRVYLAVPRNNNWGRYKLSGAFWNEYTALSNQVVDELYQRYADHPSLAGFYIPTEPSNLPGVIDYTIMRSHWLRPVSAHIREHFPDKQIVLSPYFNPAIGRAQDYADWLARTVAVTEIDVIALQDGAGNLDRDAATLDEWYSLVGAGVTESGGEMWGNLNTYIKPEFSPAGSELYGPVIAAISPYVSHNIAFSPTHYWDETLWIDFDTWRMQER